MNKEQQTPQRIRKSEWYEVVVRYDRQMEDGITKKVTESYIVDAFSFAEAEARTIAEMQQLVNVAIDVRNITPCPFSEIIFNDPVDDDRWYKARLAFITIDEKSEKEKYSYVYYLVQAATFERAKTYITQAMSGTMLDYVIKSIKETKYVEVFEHTSK